MSVVAILLNDNGQQGPNSTLCISKHYDVHYTDNTLIIVLKTFVKLRFN